MWDKKTTGGSVYPHGGSAFMNIYATEHPMQDHSGSSSRPCIGTPNARPLPNAYAVTVDLDRDFIWIKDCRPASSGALVVVEQEVNRRFGTRHGVDIQTPL